jgi:TonB family protein
MKQDDSDGVAGNLPKRTLLARWLPVAAALLLATAGIQAQIPPASDALNKGVQAFRNGSYAEAANYLNQAVALDPQSVTARSYLATTYMMQYIPGAESAENTAVAQAALRTQNLPLVEEGIASLETALAIDPEYDDAMAYMNLLYRERADLQDSEDAWKSDTLLADQWVDKTLAMKKLKAARAASNGGSPGFQTQTAPPPPPPPPTKGEAEAAAGRQIALSGPQQMGRLISRVDPVYPAQAQAARISDTVRFNAIIDTDGRIRNLALVSGHPLMVPEAQTAVRQWVYEPTLLNGEPVEVVTTIDVNFSLR